VNRGKERHMSGLAIEVKKTGDMTVFKCSGVIDYANFNHGDDAVKKAVDEGSAKIIFDLGEVSYISSSGWSVFIGNLRAAREKGGDIILANMTEEVKYTFKLLELDNLIDNFDTVEEAKKRMI
jgi:anti-sigma B factor antagonist